VHKVIHMLNGAVFCRKILVILPFNPRHFSIIVYRKYNLLWKKVVTSLNIGKMVMVIKTS
jgi:hypothetical protein